MIVLDASVLIAHLDARDPHHDRAEELLIETAIQPLGASVISLAETLVAPARSGRLPEAQAALERLAVTQLSLTSDAAAHLALLRADTGRKLPDCCVLLAAQEHAGVVASFDDALTSTARRLGLGTMH